MNKKEISEIKKQFTPNNCAITRICGCYVDGEKNKKTKLKEAFLSLSEEEMFKYFEIFKKTLSGTVGKNLINMEFPLEQEIEAEEESVDTEKVQTVPEEQKETTPGSQIHLPELLTGSLCSSLNHRRSESYIYE